MKKLKLVLSLVLLVSIVAVGQVSVNVNLGTPPVWAPAAREEVQYYYLPDIDAYYDVPSARFIYIKNGSWIRSSALPYRYRNYNLRGGNVVFLSDYRGRSPYAYHNAHKIKYAKKMDYNDRYDDNKRDNHDYKHDNGNNGRGNGKKNK